MLSEKNIKELNKFIDNDNFKDILKLIKEYKLLTYINDKQNCDNKFIKFFNEHGLLTLNWGDDDNTLTKFVHLFNKYNDLHILNNIIDLNGFTTIENLNTIGNIFDVCYSFKKEVKSLINWKNVGQGAIGSCEILLKFILFGAYTPTKGDVGIKTNNINKIIEVKTITSTSGPRLSGQVGGIKEPWYIYYALNNTIFNTDTSVKYAQQCLYFAKKKSNSGLTLFYDTFKKSNIDDEQLIIGILDAILYQYNFADLDIKNKKIINKHIDNYNDLKNNVLYFFRKNNNKINIELILDIIGSIQLYCYSQVEKFDYLFFIYSDNNSKNDGKYFLLKGIHDFININKNISILKFGPIEKNARGKTGKIKFR